MAGRHKTPDDERSEDATQAASAAAAATGKAKPRSRAVTLRAGRNPKLARASGGVWSSKREQKFFTALAETCNVTLAAEAAGVHPARAYERRRSVAAFRQAWGEALAIG